MTIKYNERPDLKIWKIRILWEFEEIQIHLNPFEAHQTSKFHKKISHIYKLI